jgi:hypothetical protein
MRGVSKGVKSISQLNDEFFFKKKKNSFDLSKRKKEKKRKEKYTQQGLIMK